VSNSTYNYHSKKNVSQYFLLQSIIATSSSPMQISPTSTSSTAISSITTTTSLSTSSRHNIPTRSGQGVQRSASSCDAENRPGPIKRLKPSLPVESASASTATAIATIKKYTPLVRRPLTTAITPVRPIQSKQSTLNKQRSLPMETSSTRPSRSLTINNNTSNHRTPNGSTQKTSHIATIPTKQTVINSSPPPPPRPATFPRKQRLSIFGEQFSDDILKTNLLWININELDDEGRTEVLIQFNSMENFLREQQLFCAKQQQQLKLAAKNKTVVNRSRLQLLIPKQDRLELL
jgi:hypothetical protein